MTRNDLNIKVITFYTEFSSLDFFRENLKLFSSESSLSESEDISMSSVIYSGIFFPLTIYLCSSKST